MTAIACFTLALFVMALVAGPLFSVGQTEELVEDLSSSLQDAKERYECILRDLELDHKLKNITEEDYLQTKQELTEELARIESK